MRRLERKKRRFGGGNAERGYVRGELDRRILVSRGGDSALTYYEGEEEPM
jgi:hypothetical protein